MKNKTEILSLRLTNNEISVKEFSSRLYQLNQDNELFNELILINFNSKYSRQEAIKIITSFIGKSEIEKYKTVQLLESIKSRDEKSLPNLLKTYDLRCRGYWFLEELGIYLALKIISSRNEKISSIADLDEETKKELNNKILPKAVKEASRIMDLLETGKIILTGETIGSHLSYCWIDNRDDEEIDSKEFETITFHSKSSNRIRETKTNWLQGGPLLEISSIKNNTNDKERIINQEIDSLKKWNSKFAITTDNQTFERYKNEFIEGYVDQGKTNRQFTINCLIELSGRRKAKFEIIELSNEFYSTNLYMYGSRIAAFEWNEIGITEYQEKEIIKASKEYIAISKPVLLAIGYEEDCTSFFDTDKTYPSNEYRIYNLSIKSITERANRKENGFEYVYIDKDKFD